MCYTTMVMDPAYANVSGVDYYEVDTSMGTFKFAQSPRGVVPSLLEDLAVYRKKAKKDMAECKARGDSWGEALANGKQLAYKITMNSVYGFLGATKGMLPIVPIAASVTATGRGMIKHTKDLVEKLVPGSRVVYGDSVAGYTPCIVRDPSGTVSVTTVELLADSHGIGPWTPVDGGKESCEMRQGVQSWSDAGWTDLHRVIRHRAAKPMIRVLTHTGVVDVTADHSLLRADATPVSPRDVCIGDALLHADLPGISDGAAPTDAQTTEARAYGFMFGDGSASEVIPDWILSGPRDVREAFWRGMCDADGDKDPTCTRIDLKSQLSAAHIFILAESLGFKTSLNTRHDVIRITVTHGPQRYNPVTVKEIHEIPISPDAYVYDLTTQNHHFAAGVGRLIVHNTDSVMVIFDLGQDKRHDVKAHFDVAQRVAAEVSGTFLPPNELEHEKCYYPYLLFSKKRYAGKHFFLVQHK